MVAMLSARSAGPYIPDIPMQPRPIAETGGPARPSVVIFMGQVILSIAHGRVGGSFTTDRASAQGAFTGSVSPPRICHRRARLPAGVAGNNFYQRRTRCGQQ